MSPNAPHFFLHLEARQEPRQGKWRFILEAADGSTRFEAEDTETEARGDRLELLAAIRGLEALDQPSRVTVTTPSRYVSQGVSYGLEEWRNNGWEWESYGQMVPVKNRDLWQRMDRALSFHELAFKARRFDPAHPAVPAPAFRRPPLAGAAVERDRRVGPRPGRRLAQWRRRFRERAEAWRLSIAQLGLPGLMPRPWLG